MSLEREGGPSLNPEVNPFRLDRLERIKNYLIGVHPKWAPEEVQVEAEIMYSTMRGELIKAGAEDMHTVERVLDIMEEGINEHNQEQKNKPPLRHWFAELDEKMHHNWPY